MLTDIILGYGFVSLSHLFLQISFGHAEAIRRKTVLKNHTPSVAIIVPEYNESPELFIRCIKSCLNQDYKGRYVVLAIDDGSKNKEAIQSVKNECQNQMLTIIELPQNVGKRRAQKAAFDIVDTNTDVIMTLDSDTILEPNAVSKLVRQFSDPEIGAITGDAYVYKRSDNLLTRLIGARYWVAFNQERAAQSLFGTVLCATGVISAYRASLINELKDRYTSQTFRGKECTYGDDRHLTNLVLECGYKVVFEPEAIGWTDTPKNMKAYLKQQLRWNRSFYRELIVTTKMIIQAPLKYPVYMVYDLIMQAVLPISLLGAILFMGYRAINLSPLYVVAFLGTIIGVSLLRCLYAIARTGDMNFLLFPLYSFIHLFLLIPLRIYAILTLSAKGWGTR